MLPEDGGQNTEDKPKVRSESLRQMMMLASNLDDSSLPLNESHISTLIAQKGEVTQFIHEDRKRDFEKFKHESWDNKFFFVVAIVVWLIVFGVSMAYAKEYLITILASTLTFLGGYGVGSKIQSKE